METLKTLLAYLGRVWTAVWIMIKAATNYVVDPPPKAIKVYFFLWLVSCALGIVLWNKGLGWVNHRLAVMAGLSSDVATVSAPLPLAAIPKLPDVISTVPPPAPIAVKEVEDEKPKAKAAAKTSKVAAKPKRKAKKKESDAFEPWRF